MLFQKKVKDKPAEPIGLDTGLPDSGLPQPILPVKADEDLFSLKSPAKPHFEHIQFDDIDQEISKMRELLQSSKPPVDVGPVASPSSSPSPVAANPMKSGPIQQSSTFQKKEPAIKPGILSIEDDPFLSELRRSEKKVPPLLPSISKKSPGEKSVSNLDEKRMEFRRAEIDRDDDLLEEKETSIMDRIRTLESDQALLGSKEDQIKKLVDRLLLEEKNLKQERALLQKERVEHKNAALEMKKDQELLSVKETDITNRIKQLIADEKALRRQEASIVRKVERLEKTEAMVKEEKQKLDLAKKEYRESDLDLSRREKAVEKKASYADKRYDQLKGLEETIKDRESQLKKLLEEVKRQKGLLEKEEDSIVKKISDMEAQEEGLKKRMDGLNKRESLLADGEKMIQSIREKADRKAEDIERIWTEMKKKQESLQESMKIVKEYAQYKKQIQKLKKTEQILRERVSAEYRKLGEALEKNKHAQAHPIIHERASLQEAKQEPELGGSKNTAEPIDTVPAVNDEGSQSKSSYPEEEIESKADMATRMMTDIMKRYQQLKDL